MKYLFTTQGFFLNRAVTFTVSKISVNLYLADCTDDTIKRFIVKKNGATWVSDNEMTQFITAKIGVMIDKIENDKMKKIQDFVRSCFAPSAVKETAAQEPAMSRQFARM